MLIDSTHWRRKRKYRPDIKDYMIEFSIQNSNILRDKDDSTAFNAIS